MSITRSITRGKSRPIMRGLGKYSLSPWYGFRLIKGQTETLVTEIGSDPETIANKPVSSTDRVYPAIVDQAGNVVYKLGGTTGNDLTMKMGTSTPSNLDGTDGEVMTVFEPFYFRCDIWSDGNNTYEDWKFSLYNLAGYTRFPRFFMGIYPTYYDSGNDILRSISGVTPEIKQRRSWYREKAANVGSGWCITPYHYYNILYHLLVAERLNLNSQEDISTGALNASSGDWSDYNGYYPVWQSHGGAASSYGSGTVTATPSDPNTADVRTGKISLTVDNWGDGTLTLNTQMAVIWHCRDLFGHLWGFVDGLNLYNSSENGARAFVSRNPAYFKDDTEQNYHLAGNIAESGGYVSQFLRRHILPTTTSGGSSEHCGDYHYTYYNNSANSGWRVARVGGDLNDGSQAGLSCFYVANDSSNDNSHLGARLCKIS